MSEPLTASITNALRHRVAGKKVVVFCSQQADVSEWERLLMASDLEAALVLAFDGPLLSSLRPSAGHRGATRLLEYRHEQLANLDGDSPMARLVNEFDHKKQAILLVTDPLDPPLTGDRQRLVVLC